MSVCDILWSCIRVWNCSSRKPTFNSGTDSFLVGEVHMITSIAMSLRVGKYSIQSWLSCAPGTIIRNLEIDFFELLDC